MSQEIDYETLRALPVAAELNDDEVAVLAAVVRHRKLGDGDYLLREGEVDDTLYIVAGGVLEAVKDAQAGDKVSLHVYRSGDMVGELGFIDGSEHSASLKAVGPVEVMAVERDAFEALLTTHPAVVYKVMRAIIRTVHTIVRRMNLQYVELTNYITKQHGKY